MREEHFTTLPLTMAFCLFPAAELASLEASLESLDARANQTELDVINNNDTLTSEISNLRVEDSTLNNDLESLETTASAWHLDSAASIDALEAAGLSRDDRMLTLEINLSTEIEGLVTQDDSLETRIELGHGCARGVPAYSSEGFGCDCETGYGGDRCDEYGEVMCNSSSAAHMEMVGTMLWKVVSLTNLTVKTDCDIHELSQHVPTLRHVTNVMIVAPTNLTDLSILAEVEGVESMRVVETGVADWTHLERQRTLRTLVLGHNLALRELDLSQLPALIDVTIEGEPTLEQIVGPKHTASYDFHSASFTFVQNDALLSITGFNELEAINGLVIAFNPSLTTVDGFRKLKTIGLHSAEPITTTILHNPVMTTFTVARDTVDGFGGGFALVWRENNLLKSEVLQLAPNPHQGGWLEDVVVRVNCSGRGQNRPSLWSGDEIGYVCDDEVNCKCSSFGREMMAWHAGGEGEVLLVERDDLEECRRVCVHRGAVFCELKLGSFRILTANLFISFSLDRRRTPL